MRIATLFLTSLFLCNVSFVSAHDTPKGYVKDNQGRTLVYRAQPSWWLLPSGSLLTLFGSLVAYDGLYEVNPAPINLGASFKLSDIWPDLHKILANIRMNIPLKIIDGKSNPARAIRFVLGAGVTVSGAALLYSWFDNYFKLSTPLIVIDKEGLQYEGNNKIYWKDVKSVHVVHDTTFNWSNNTGKFKKEYALEIVNTYDKFLINEGDIAVTLETLEELIKHYFRKYW